MLLPALSKLHLKQGFTPRSKDGASTEWYLYYNGGQPQYISKDDINYIEDVGTDGNCLYYALYSLLYDTHSSNKLNEAMDIRSQLAKHIVQNSEFYTTDKAGTLSEMRAYVIQNDEERPAYMNNVEYVERYARLLYNPKQRNDEQENMWGGDVEIIVAANAFNTTIHRYAHKTNETDHTNENLILQLTAFPDRDIVKNPSHSDAEPWKIIRIGDTGVNGIKKEVKMGQEYFGHFMYVLPTNRRMMSDSGDGFFSSPSANKRSSDAVSTTEPDKKAKPKTQDSDVMVTAETIASQSRDTGSLTRKKMSEAFTSIGFKRVNIEGKGDCYPLSVMAGYEIKDEKELQNPTATETKDLINKVRNGAIDILTSKQENKNLKHGNIDVWNMRTAYGFSNSKDAETKMHDWRKSKTYGSSDEDHKLSFSFESSIAMYLGRQVAILRKTISKSNWDDTVVMYGEIDKKRGTHKENRITFDQLIELLKTEDDISVIEHNGTNHYDAWIRDFSNTNQVDIMYDILMNEDLKTMSIDDKEKHIKKIVRQIQFLSDAINKT